MGGASSETGQEFIKWSLTNVRTLTPQTARLPDLEEKPLTVDDPGHSHQKDPQGSQDS